MVRFDCESLLNEFGNIAGASKTPNGSSITVEKNVEKNIFDTIEERSANRTDDMHHTTNIEKDNQILTSKDTNVNECEPMLQKDKVCDHSKEEKNGSTNGIFHENVNTSDDNNRKKPKHIGSLMNTNEPGFSEEEDEEENTIHSVQNNVVNEKPLRYVYNASGDGNTKGSAKSNETNPTNQGSKSVAEKGNVPSFK